MDFVLFILFLARAMNSRSPCYVGHVGQLGWDDKPDKNVHWGDFRVLKRCLVKRWEDITKLDTCLHSLWSKRKNLEDTLGEARGQLGGVERALPSLSTAIDVLTRDIDEAEAKWRDIHKEREGDVDCLLAAANRRSSSPCPCRRFTETLTSTDLPQKDLRALMTSVGGLKSQQNDLRRKIDEMRADLSCKLSEQRNLENRREHLKNVIERVTRNLLNVNEECEAVNARWKSYRCEVEKLESQMKEQWGPSALDRLTPANVSRSRFF